jgi:exodeoxyribonuclease V alpha subunit
MSQDTQPSRLDIAFSHFLSLHATPLKKKQAFELIISKLSYQHSQGHNCIQLNQSELSVINEFKRTFKDTPSPIVLEDNRLYLHRYWDYENRLAKQINNLLSYPSQCHNLNTILNQYFPQLTTKTDWQKEAVIKAINNSLCIISGGPGTGKTTTVVKILALLLELKTKENNTPRIALTAPTGKAAMRLQESINSNKAKLPCSHLIKSLIPETVSTIHRLLGSHFYSPYFKHDSSHPLPYDVIIVDEASMVDLALMSKLVDALKPNSKLILLGDKDQLSSVESGSVLADITVALPEQIIELKKSYRFNEEIKKLSDAVNTQSYNPAWEMLKNGHQIKLLDQKLIDFAAEKYSTYLLHIKNNVNLKTIFSEFNKFQILCANRYGIHGTIEINKRIEEKLFGLNKIHSTNKWYHGRPVMVTQNNAGIQFFNGDIGICLYDQDSKNLAVFFLRPDDGIKKLLPNRVPPHETVFAMTIHKSQGSEFDECLCVLPDIMNPVLSKELIYTAITRSKTKFTIRSNYSIFCTAIQKKNIRLGGLYEKLSQKGIKTTGNN